MESQLPGRAHHECLGLAFGGEFFPTFVTGQGDAQQDGDAEGECFASASTRLPNKIRALDGNRDRHGLDRERGDNSHPFQRLADIFSDAEVGEGGGNGNSSLGQCLGLFVRGPVKARCRSCDVV